jgi:hypothetical protein
MNFFSLPVDVYSSVIFLWSDTNGICLLDTACCNKSSREDLLFSLSAENRKHKTTFRGSISFVSWLILRKIRIDGEFRIGPKAISILIDQEFTDFPALNFLTKLTMPHSNSSATLFKVLDECFDLENLSIMRSNCLFNDEAGDSVALCCSKLTSVEFSYSKHIGRGFMQLFCQSHKQITSFHAGSCSAFDENCLLMTCQSWQLSVLNVSKNDASSEERLDKTTTIINDITMKALLLQHSLVELNISGNRISAKLNDFEKFLQNNTNLTSLNIGYCFRLIHDDTLHLISKHCLLIRTLGLGSRPDFDSQSFTGLGVLAIGLKCVHLTSLDLSGFIMELGVAINLMKTLTLLSDIRIGNSSFKDHQCNVCVFFAALVFESVTSISQTRGFSITGHQHQHQSKVYTVEEVVSMSRFACDADSGGGGKILYPLLPKDDSLTRLTAHCDDKDHLLLDYLKSSGRSLEYLDLSFLKGDKFLLSVSEVCCMLKIIELTFSDVVNNDGLIALCKNNPSLESVILIRLKLVSNVGLSSGVALLKNLRTLNLSLDNVTCTAVAPVLKSNAGLSLLELSCKKIPRGNLTISNVLKTLHFLECVKWSA